MTRFLLDTNIPSELIRIRPEPKVIQWLEAVEDQELYFSVVSIGEICKGFTIHPDERRRDRLREWLDHTLRPWFQGRILPVTDTIAERWGILEGQCQLAGLTLLPPDGLIAATALEHDLTLGNAQRKRFRRFRHRCLQSLGTLKIVLSHLCRF